jgi:hypothetical protein
MPRSPTLSGVLVLVLALTGLRAHAAPDESIPYPAQPQAPNEDRNALPNESNPTYVPPVEYPYEAESRDERLSDINDPGPGLYAEFLAAAMFVEATRGSLVDARLGLGARITWDMGRIFPSDLLRQALFIDFQYIGTSFREGTELFFTDTQFHYLTLAPAWAFPFGDGSPYAFYLQLGGGVAIVHSALSAEGAVTPETGFQPVFQYGLGFRGQPRLGGLDSALRLSFRVEVTRFQRGYAADTYIGGSIGLGF